MIAQYGMKFYAGKSEYKVKMERREEAGLVIGGEELEMVESFKYIGSVKQEEGRLDFCREIYHCLVLVVI